MKLHIYDTYEEMSRAAANIVSAQLLLKPDSHVGLTAGKTPVGMFANLVRLYQNKTISFADAWFYNLEEKIGAAKDDPSTCRSYFHKHFMDETDASPERLLLPDSQSQDIAAECEKYDLLLNNLPGGRLDMQILGIGEDAHIGMNRPNEALNPATHKELRPSGEYIAMGVSHILLAKRILLIANGESKAQAVADMFAQGISSAVPATLLKLHPNVIVLLDKPAASKLTLT
jgi:glucosamine-6-phosphate deaminase